GPRPRVHHHRAAAVAGRAAAAAETAAETAASAAAHVTGAAYLAGVVAVEQAAEEAVAAAAAAAAEGRTAGRQAEAHQRGPGRQTDPFHVRAPLPLTPNGRSRLALDGKRRSRCSRPAPQSCAIPAAGANGAGHEKRPAGQRPQAWEANPVFPD